jgi:membrane protease YdiL (CAAX protease family)
MPSSASQIVPFIAAIGSGIFLAFAILEFRFHPLWNHKTRRGISKFIIFSLGLSLAIPAAFFFTGLAEGEPPGALFSESINLLFIFIQAAFFGVIYLGATLSQRQRGNTPPLLASNRTPFYRRIAEIIIAAALCAVWTALCMKFAKWLVGEIEISEKVKQLLERPSPLSKDTIALTIWLPMIFLAPLFEEITFRGFILGQCLMAVPENKRTALPAKALAVAFTAALFALMHNGHLEPAWVKWLQIFGIGIILGFIRLRHGLTAAILTHLIFNAFGGLLIF